MRDAMGSGGGGGGAGGARGLILRSPQRLTASRGSRTRPGVASRGTDGKPQPGGSGRRRHHRPPPNPGGATSMSGATATLPVPFPEPPRLSPPRRACTHTLGDRAVNTAGPEHGTARHACERVSVGGRRGHGRDGERERPVPASRGPWGREAREAERAGSPWPPSPRAGGTGAGGARDTPGD